MAVAFQFDFERSLAAMAYICERDPVALDTYKMCKLIFLADKLHLVRHGRTITGDRICALEHGPVPSETYRILKHVLDGNGESEAAVQAAKLMTFDRSFYYPRILMSGTEELIRENLSASDCQALQEVVRQHGSKSFAELRAFTHEMPAYKNAWDVERSVNNPVMAFEDMFEEDGDALAGVREEMIEDYHLREAFLAAV